MQTGFPFKKKIVNRGYPVNLGGNYRYRYDLCPRARTVVVTDMDLDVGTFAPLSIASSARVATINLTAGATYYGIVYRSVAQEVWVFGTTNVIVIDANPSSGTFNTIINTITTTAFASNSIAITYSPVNDSFYFNNQAFPCNNFLNPITLIGSGFGAVFATTNSGYIPSVNGIVQGGANGECNLLVRPDNGDMILAFGGTSNNFSIIKVGNKYYSGASTGYRRFSWPQSRQEASITLAAGSSRGDVAYNPITKHFVIGNNNFTQVLVGTIVPFASVGNLQSAMSTILAANQNSVSSVQYCPYNGKIYLKASNTSPNLTGINRYFIIDTSQSLANMVCGYRTVDESGHLVGNMYWNTMSCFNGLKINEYES